MKKMNYITDKPKDCKNCYFWQGRNKGCGYSEGQCYYTIKEAQNKKTECDGCPYGRDHPCIGWCMKKVLQEVGHTK